MLDYLRFHGALWISFIFMFYTFPWKLAQSFPLRSFKVPTKRHINKMGCLGESSTSYGSVAVGNDSSSPAKLNVDDLLDKMRLVHDSGANLSYEWRMKQLKLLLRLVQENTDEICHALRKDLGREGTEAILIETKPLEMDIKHTMKNLKKWMAPKAVPSPGAVIPAWSYIQTKPLISPGVLIIAPYNYPVRLVLQPLLGSLAGGNPTVVKPSEMTPNVALLLKELLEKYYTEPGVVQVVLGGVPEVTELLQRRWGKVFFTGSERVGKIVQKACAETMTPTIMELGGKCPTVVDETVSTSQLQNVADRIIFAKCLNAGQTCVAPDTLFVHEQHTTALCQALVRSIKEQFGKNQKTGELARIVNTSNAQRIVDLIKDAEKLGTKLIHGGSKLCDSDTKYICPTLLLDPPQGARILKEEVFGPTMTIVSFSSREEGIRLIQDLPGEPLHMYVFTPRISVFEEYTDKCRSSGAVRNDVIVQGASPHLPLGGLGTSGHGNYYGKFSYDSFTHTFPVFHRPIGSIYDHGNLRCHPFAGKKGWLLENIGLNIPEIPVLHTRKLLFLLGAGSLISISPDLSSFLKLGLVSAIEQLLVSLKK